MNYLITRDGQGIWRLRGIPWKQLHEGAVITKDVAGCIYGALCKLKAYEATGLTPSEVDRIYRFEGTNSERLMVELEKHRWRSPDEELPIGQTVLVQVSGNPKSNVTLENTICVAEYYDVEGWVIDEWLDWKNPNVIAWMPLPEPYHEGEK